jgi:hypothetical protein
MRAASAAPDAIDSPCPSEPEQKSTPGSAVAVQGGAVDEPAQRQRRVQRQGGVPLRQHEAVAVRRPGRRDLEDLAVEDGEDVRDAHRRPDVADVGALRLLEHDPPYVRGVEGRRHGDCAQRGSIAAPP